MLLRQLSAEVISLLEGLALAPDGSFFSDAGNDDLAEKLYFQIFQRLSEEFNNASGRLKVVFLERHG